MTSTEQSVSFRSMGTFFTTEQTLFINKSNSYKLKLLHAIFDLKITFQKCFFKKSRIRKSSCTLHTCTQTCHFNNLFLGRVTENNEQIEIAQGHYTYIYLLLFLFHFKFLLHKFSAIFENYCSKFKISICTLFFSM